MKGNDRKSKRALLPYLRNYIWKMLSSQAVLQCIPNLPNNMHNFAHFMIITCILSIMMDKIFSIQNTLSSVFQSPNRKFFLELFCTVRNLNALNTAKLYLKPQNLSPFTVFKFKSGKSTDTGFCSPLTVFQEKTFEKKNECFPKKPSFEPSQKGFQRSQLSNSVSADSLPVESAQQYLSRGFVDILNSV